MKKNRFMMRKMGESELYVHGNCLFAGSGFREERTDIWKIYGDVTKAILKEHKDQQGISICY